MAHQPLSKEQLRDKVKTIIIGIDNGNWYDSKVSSIVDLILADRNAAVREARIEETKYQLNKIVPQVKKGIGASWHRGYVSAQYTIRKKFKDRLKSLQSQPNAKEGE